MAATIKIKNSSTASAVPTSSDLVQGELAVNVTDKRLFTENASGTVVELGTNPTILTLPDGSASAPTLTNDGDTNTGIFFPAADTVAVTTGGSERARVDSSGSLGLGVTPSAWSGKKVLQASNASFAGQSDRFEVWSNAYYDGSAVKYISNGYATLYQSVNGQHIWFNAASGTAGNTATLTQAMTLDTNGDLLVGATSAGFYQGSGLLIKRSGYATVRLNDSAGTSSELKYADSLGLVLETVNNRPIVFSVNASERARIDTSGNLLVGTTGLDGRFRVEATSTQWARATNHTNSGTQYFDSFRYNGTQIGYITGNNTNTTYSTSSDYRLKENIAPMTGALAVVQQLKPCTYNWKIDGSDGQGFIAHELAEVVPDCVTGEKDAVDADGNPVYQGIDTSFLVATLTAAIQEQQAIITQLQADVAALKG